MERTRRVVSGRVAELFGPDVLDLDKFSRTMGYRRLGEQMWHTHSAGEQAWMQAYADGVNDFVKSIKLAGDGSAHLLPPEFYLFGLDKKEWEPWTPIDSMAIMKMMELSLTWDWTQDYTREVQKMENPELAELVDLIMPYTQANMGPMVTILDDDDVKRMGQWSDKTLSQRYFENIDHLLSAEPDRGFKY